MSLIKLFRTLTIFFVATFTFLINAQTDDCQSRNYRSKQDELMKINKIVFSDKKDFYTINDEYGFSKEVPYENGVSILNLYFLYNDDICIDLEIDNNSNFIQWSKEKNFRVPTGLTFNELEDSRVRIEGKNFLIGPMPPMQLKTKLENGKTITIQFNFFGYLNKQQEEESVLSQCDHTYLPTKPFPAGDSPGFKILSLENLKPDGKGGYEFGAGIKTITEQSGFPNGMEFSISEESRGIIVEGTSHIMGTYYPYMIIQLEDGRIIEQNIRLEITKPRYYRPGSPYPTLPTPPIFERKPNKPPHHHPHPHPHPCPHPCHCPDHDHQQENCDQCSKCDSNNP